jgi:hypothetical protein
MMLMSSCLRKLIGFLLCDVAIGEAIGLHTTLEWVSNLKFDNVNFALDSHKVVDSFQTSVDDNSDFGSIINACRQLFQDSFQNFDVEFNRR